MPVDSYQEWVQLDFLLAVILTVIIPLILLFSSLSHQGLVGRILAYWRISALLAITVYLLMAEISLGLITGVMARILIPPVLWLGDGLMQSTHLHRNSTVVYKAFSAWRIALTLYCIAGVIFTFPLLACGLTGQVTTKCAFWYVPPQKFGALFHEPESLQTFGEVAQFALIIYAFYLLIAIYKSVAIRQN
jgi:hypothetical protein